MKQWHWIALRHPFATCRIAWGILIAAFKKRHVDREHERFEREKCLARMRGDGITELPNGAVLFDERYYTREEALEIQRKRQEHRMKWDWS